jgi:hypothetical protein
LLPAHIEEGKPVKQCLCICAVLLAAWATAARTTAQPPAPGVGALGQQEAQKRCYPSRCSCRGMRAVQCSRDCRRDRRCACVQGKYVCSLYVRR